MEAKKFIGKVLPDGHLSLPKDESRNIGKFYEVILLSYKKDDIYKYTEELSKGKIFGRIKENDLEKIIHESRGVK